MKNCLPIWKGESVMAQMKPGLCYEWQVVNVIACGCELPGIIGLLEIRLAEIKLSGRRVLCQKCWKLSRL